jgi:ribonuclease P protein component
VPGLRRALRLRSPRDFAAVRAHGRTVHGAALLLGWRANDLSHNQYGFVVGKRVGNAVTRNLVKRRLRAIIQQLHPEIAPGHALVITAKAAAAGCSFTALQGEMQQLLRRAKLYHTANTRAAAPPAPGDPSPTDPQEGSS